MFHDHALVANVVRSSKSMLEILIRSSERAEMKYIPANFVEEAQGEFYEYVAVYQ